MAEPGTDAAEGDGSRTAASVTRAAGWRVPSGTTTLSGLPDAWIDGALVPSDLITAGTPADDAADSRDALEVRHAELAEFGRSEAMIRRWRGWSFLRRNRASEADGSSEPVSSDAPADLDLVALAAEDDLLLDADEHVWTDLTLAALEETDSDDAWTPVPDRSGPGAEVHGGPWSALAEELQGAEHGSTEPAPDTTPSTTLELEEEFWARGTR